MITIRADGSMDMLTASGVTRLMAAEGRELFELYGYMREHSGGPRVVNEWLTAGASPRAIAPLLEREMRRRGVTLGCRLCEAHVDGRRCSRARLRRLHGLDAGGRSPTTGTAQLLPQRRHVGSRRGESLRERHNVHHLCRLPEARLKNRRG